MRRYVRRKSKRSMTLSSADSGKQRAKQRALRGSTNYFIRKQAANRIRL